MEYESSYFGPLSAGGIFVELSSPFGSGDFSSCLSSGDFFSCLLSSDFSSTCLSLSDGFGVTDEGIADATVGFPAAPSFSEYDGGLTFHLGLVWFMTIKSSFFLRFGLTYQFLPPTRQFVEGAEDRVDYERKMMVVQNQEGKEGPVQRTHLVVMPAFVQMASILVEEVEVQTAF